CPRVSLQKDSRARCPRSQHCHPASSAAARLAAATNAAILSASLTPFVSTPLLTSTPQGRAVRIARPTFSARKPPATIILCFPPTSRASSQSNEVPVPPCAFG